MQIANEFTLGAPLDRAWPLLTDLERVAPAMPGATVTGVDADGIDATMKVKIGPIAVGYRMRVELVSQDAAQHVAVLKASGRESRGAGTVEATVTAELRDEGERTQVALTTDLSVTGRVAQFGGGVMKEVADRLLRQFAQRLEQQVVSEAAGEQPAAEGSTPAPGAAAAASGTSDRPATAPVPESPPADLGRLTGAALLPRGAAAGSFAGAFLGTFLATVLAALLLRRRRP